MATMPISKKSVHEKESFPANLAKELNKIIAF
jgi:hypothetical protein